MMAGAMVGGPERIQEAEGPPWTNASPVESRMLNRMLRTALGVVVKMQYDLGVDRDVLLEQLWYMAHGRVSDAQEMVPIAQDGGGAYAKIAFVQGKFPVQVLTEVHDLLYQLTRPDQVSTVMVVLEGHSKKGVDLGALRRLCGADEPARRPRRLTNPGKMLWQLLVRADPAVRAKGHALFLERRRVALPSPRASPALLAAMPSAGSGAPPLAYTPRPQGSLSTSSSNTPGSDASSAASSNKRPDRPMGSASVADGPMEGEDIAGGADT